MRSRNCENDDNEKIIGRIITNRSLKQTPEMEQRGITAAVFKINLDK